MSDGKQSGTKLSRRSLLSGAITLGGGAAIATAVQTPVAVLGAPAVVVPKKFHPIVASSSKNIVETTEGKIYGFSRDGVIGYRGIPYGESTEGANRFMPPQKAKPSPLNTPPLSKRISPKPKNAKPPKSPNAPKPNLPTPSKARPPFSNRATTTPPSRPAPKAPPGS